MENLKLSQMLQVTMLIITLIDDGFLPEVFHKWLRSTTISPTSILSKHIKQSIESSTLSSFSILTFSVSTTTTKQIFSTMKLLKTPLCNKMEDDFLTDCMVIYIEREIADIIDLEYIIDEFDCVKSRKINFK
ncbi:hypothetical protein ACOSQ2_003555 [Xanthoceras sorbifolium]